MVFCSCCDQTRKSRVERPFVLQYQDELCFKLMGSDDEFAEVGLRDEGYCGGGDGFANKEIASAKILRQKGGAALACSVGGALIG